MAMVSDHRAFLARAFLASDLTLTGDGKDSVDSKQDTADMAVFGFSERCIQIGWGPEFTSTDVVFLDFNALDEMGSRIDELEQSINDLRAEMGAEHYPPPVHSRPTDDSKSPKES
ncbi:hypothetical protein DITRI_Ditri08aG0014400 [Diplodiscus trichospermus]